MSHTHVYHRREKILQLLRQQQRQRVTVKALAQQFDVSEWTVRRDLAILENKDQVRRYHGGVELAIAPDALNNFELNEQKQHQAKIVIGKRAAQLVKSGQFVALAAGTTTTQVGLALRGRSNIAIMTNALNIAKDLSRESGIRLTCAGGEVHGDYYTLTGPVTERTLNIHYYDVAIVGVSGVSVDNGFSVDSQTNAVIIDIMMRNAAKVIIVVDHTKFGRVSYAHLADLSRVDIIVTDRLPPTDIQERLQSLNIQLILA